MGESIKVGENINNLNITSGILCALSMTFLRDFELKDLEAVRAPYGKVITVPEGCYRVKLSTGRPGEAVHGVIKVDDDNRVFIGDPLWVVKKDCWPDFLDDTESDHDLWTQKSGVVLNTRARGDFLIKVDFEAICEADTQLPELRF
jgi:hypothetical protein